MSKKVTPSEKELQELPVAEATRAKDRFGDAGNVVVFVLSLLSLFTRYYTRHVVLHGSTRLMSVC
jgi:hypothetical protein